MLKYLYEDLKLSICLLFEQYEPIGRKLSSQKQKRNSKHQEQMQNESKSNQFSKQKESLSDNGSISQTFRQSLRISYRLPLKIEAYFWLYALYGLYTVLKTMVLIPLDLLIGIAGSMVSILNCYKSKHNSLFSVLIIVAFYIYTRQIQYLDVSFLYHTFRGQSTLKLYGLMFAFEISEKILTMIGQYLIDSLEKIYSQTYEQLYKLIPQTILTLLYVLVHTFSIYLEFIIYIVVINSSMQNFIIFCFVINLTKMKSTAFKKYEVKSYRNQINYDAKDRMQKMIYIGLFQLSQMDRSIPSIYSKLFIVMVIGSLIEYFKHTTVLALANKHEEVNNNLLSMVEELYHGKRVKSIIRCGHWDFTVAPYCVFVLKMISVIVHANITLNKQAIIAIYLLLIALVLCLKFLLTLIGYVFFYNKSKEHQKEVEIQTENM